MPYVSYERIYQYIWEDKMRKEHLYLHLRHHGRKYRKRGAAKDSRGKICDQVSIDERPKNSGVEKSFRRSRNGYRPREKS